METKKIESHLLFELLYIFQLSIDANDDDDDDDADLPSLMTNVRMLEKRPFTYYKASFSPLHFQLFFFSLSLFTFSLSLSLSLF